VRTGGCDWDAERIIEAVWQLDKYDDISGLMQDGCTATSEVSIQQKRTANLKGRSMSKSELFEKGLKVRKEVLGEDYVNKSIAGADEFTRTMAEWSTEFCWGALWTRPGIDRRTRSIVNLAMLGALNRPHELKLHVKGALKNGLTKEEIKEILLQVAVYCGVPPASTPSATHARRSTRSSEVIHRWRVGSSHG
jgi:4-carboxymuconolactone decarboxylase